MSVHKMDLILHMSERLSHTETLRKTPKTRNGLRNCSRRIFRGIGSRNLAPGLLSRAWSFQSGCVRLEPGKHTLHRFLVNSFSRMRALKAQLANQSQSGNTAYAVIFALVYIRTSWLNSYTSGIFRETLHSRSLTSQELQIQGAFSHIRVQLHQVLTDIEKR